MMAKFIKNKTTCFLWVILIGGFVVLSFYKTNQYFSTNESCAACHVHPHAEESWLLSKHTHKEDGSPIRCIDCHLPPQNQTWAHYSAKAKMGLRDLWGYITKDPSTIDWEAKSQLEQAVRYIPNESCKECHAQLFPMGISDEGIIAHLYYEANEEALNLQCISCHLDAGHYNPHYSHAKMTGIPQAITPPDSASFFREATSVTGFRSFTEQIPGSDVSFRMIAIPAGSFKMGSPQSEPFRNADEGPQREVSVDRFFLAEIPVSWDMFWTFYAQTKSEGRIMPEETYANNSRKDLSPDAISGPTPPFGYPDQGWGAGERPAITMTHYAAQTFCQWLSLLTGKRYRLPTEAEWEYAARANTQSAYFFDGNPKKFSNYGFWRKIFSADTEPIASYVVYHNNSRNRTQPPDFVDANPFGLKHMLGNVMEYCADQYDSNAYAATGNEVSNPLVREGEEWVVRGGNYTSDAADVRCAARSHTRHDEWLRTDPQQPKSIWWYSDIKGIGFRVACDAEGLID